MMQRDWLLPPFKADGKTICAQVAARHKVPTQAILSKRRPRHIANARWEFWYLLRTELGWSYPRIAAFTGHDHTSVMHGVRRYEAAKKALAF